MRIYSRFLDSEWQIYSTIDPGKPKEEQILTIMHERHKNRSRAFTYPDLLRLVKIGDPKITPDIQAACHRWLNDVDLEYRHR